MSNKNILNFEDEKIYVEFVIEGSISGKESDFEKIKKSISALVTKALKDHDVTRMNISFAKVTETDVILSLAGSMEEN